MCVALGFRVKSTINKRESRRKRRPAPGKPGKKSGRKRNIKNGSKLRTPERTSKNMKVLKDLLSSEKGIFCLALIIAASVLTALGHMTVEQWTAYTQIIAGIYVGGKAIQGAAAAYRNGKDNELECRLDDNDAAIDEIAEAIDKKS